MLRNFSGTGYLAAPPEPTKNPNWLSFRVAFHRKEKDPVTGEEKSLTMWSRGLCSLKMIESTLQFYVAGAKVTVSTTDCWSRVIQSKDGSVSSELSLGFVDYIYAFAKPTSEHLGEKTSNSLGVSGAIPQGQQQTVKYQAGMKIKQSGSPHTVTLTPEQANALNASSVPQSHAAVVNSSSNGEQIIPVNGNQGF